MIAFVSACFELSDGGNKVVELSRVVHRRVHVGFRAQLFMTLLPVNFFFLVLLLSSLPLTLVLP